MNLPQVDAMSAETFQSVDNGSVGMRMDNQRVRFVLRAEDVPAAVLFPGVSGDR